MNKQNTDQFYTEFPQLYRGADDGKMYWVFCCGDGWFDLIYQLSVSIETELKAIGFEPSSQSWPIVSQVKEKFGTLCYYMQFPVIENAEEHQDVTSADVEIPDEVINKIRQLIGEAEVKSVTTCEECGLPGDLKNEGWWHTSCSVCEAMR